MRLRPGSFTWLVAHDLTLSWRRFRGIFGHLHPALIAGIVIATLGLFHLLAWPLTAWFMHGPVDSGSKSGLYTLIGGGFVFVLPWLISQAMNGATRTLYSRGDLDLLLASPIPPRRVLAAHAVALAVDSVASVAILLVPLTNMAALADGPHWLAVYPVLVASGLFATAVGLALTVWLFSIVGPRRTRIVSQIVATFIGAAFVLSLQVLNVIPAHLRHSLVLQVGSTEGGFLGAHSLFMLPVRAAAGETFPLLGWILLSVAVFTAVAIGLGPLFCSSALDAAGSVTTQTRASRRNAAVRPFRSGLGSILRRKERRLLARDPWLLSQMLLQIIYTLPVAIILWRSQDGHGSVAISVAPAVVVIASQISASLAWLAISSEDAAEFLATAPVSRAQIERRKLEAIGIPFVLFLAVPILGLAFDSWKTAGYTALFSLAAAASTALLNLWNPKPGRRSDLMRRHSQSKLVGMMEHVMSLCWAVAMVLTILGSTVAIVPMLLVLALLFFNRRRVTRTFSASGSIRAPRIASA